LLLLLLLVLVYLLVWQQLALESAKVLLQDMLLKELLDNPKLKVKFEEPFY
jgi:hypothetical protein